MNSETPKKHINSLVSQAIKEAGFTLENIQITEPDPEFGDYSTNAALVLAKKEKKNPQEVAEKIIAEILSLDKEKVLENVLEKGGFINFKLSKKFLLTNLQSILEQENLYGSSAEGGKQKILVEYFQPNVAKPLHLGHLRTAIIGDSLFRIFLSQGFKAESDTHLGDWGTQFGLLLLAYKKYGDIEVIKKDPITELNKLYVKINLELEQSPTLREEGKAEFVKLEKGDEENRRLWKQFKDWSWKEYEIIYSDLGVRKSDHNWPESFFEDKMPAVVEELKAKGLAKESQGALIVDLEEYKLGVAVLVKSDGGTTYLLRDLATFIFRKSQGFVKQYYVVDVRQKHTLEQTFKILELGGYLLSGEAEHISYGFLTLPEGAMSTRKGTVVGAKEFIENVQSEALKVIEEKNPALLEKEQAAKQVAAAAIKYFDLSHNIKSDIVFDPKKALSFEGNTGPYLQYTHARIYGILKKIKNQKSKIKIDDQYEFLEFKEQELAVLRKLVKFPETVSQVAEDCLPNLLCNYLFELSQAFNAFYQDVPVLSEPDENLKNFRLALISSVAQVLKNGLYLLGIEAPKEM